MMKWMYKQSKEYKRLYKLILMKKQVHFMYNHKYLLILVLDYWMYYWDKCKTTKLTYNSFLYINFKPFYYVTVFFYDFKKTRINFKHFVLYKFKGSKHW